MPRNVAGGVVRGDDLFGREREIQELWRRIERGSVLLSGPRRWGKTSVMCALNDRPRDGWHVIMVDVEYVNTPTQLLIELTAEILQRQGPGSRLRAGHTVISECLIRLRAGGKTAIEVADVGPAFEAAIGPRNRARFSHYETRLRTHYGAHETAARRILQELAQGATGLSTGDLRAVVDRDVTPGVDIEAILVLLEGDYYVSRDGDEVRFAHGFLRQWWRRNAPAGGR